MSWLGDQFRQWRTQINLDSIESRFAELVVHHPKSRRKTPRKSVALLVKRIIRQAVCDNAAAINLFYDNEDQCLRAVEYIKTPEGSWISREFAPAPGYIAGRVFDEIRRHTGVQAGRLEGAIDYCYRKQVRMARVRWESATEFRIYFSDEHPDMRNKGV